MKSLLTSMMAAVMIFAALSGCSGHKTTPDAGNITVISSSPADASDTTSTGTDTTAIVAATDKNGKTVTRTDGTPETSIVTRLTTNVVKVTTADGKTVTQKDGKAVTSIVTTPTITTTTKVPASKTTTAAPKPATTTTTRHTTTTTTTAKSPTTTTTTKPTPTTTTAAAPTRKIFTDDPWRYPYDLNKIYADSKIMVESYGIKWDETLTPENASWDNRNSTVAFSNYPDEFYLKDEMKNVIVCDYGMHKWITKGRIYIEPHSKVQGEYYVYFLYSN